MSIELGTLPPHVLEKYAKQSKGKVLTIEQICKLARKRIAKYQRIDARRRKKGLPPIDRGINY